MPSARFTNKRCRLENIAHKALALVRQGNPRPEIAAAYDCDMDGSCLFSMVQRMLPPKNH